MKRHLNIAIKASIEAGIKIMEVYDKVYEVEYKSDNSPLTEADKQANQIINKCLNYTGIPIISEENKEISYEIRKNWTMCWIVDPLDGTKEFIKRNGEFTVNIALIQNQRPVFGVIYAPVKKELYFGIVPDRKSYKKIVENITDIDLIFENAESIRPETNIPDRVRIIGSRSHMNDDTDYFIQNYEKENSSQEAEIISKGSSLKFSVMAEGKADCYPRFAPTMEWDTAAGQAICEAVGLHVISKDTGTELLYNKQSLLNPSFLVMKKRPNEK